jgi:predicted DNA-binding transcriptional regulator YafY
MNRTDRLYALVEELRATAPRARSAPRLAERFEVSVRTIERDILALQEAGVPIWATSGRGGGYTIDPAHTLPPLNFTASEAAAIALALARSGPMPFDGAARTALHKVVAAMPATGRTSAADLLARIHLMHAKRELSDAPVLRAVEEAVLERRVLCLDYCDKQGHSTEARLVEPLGFIGSERDWYLVGWCRLRSGVRVFRLDRIGTIEVTAERSPTREPPALGEECLPQQPWWHPVIVG